MLSPIIVSVVSVFFAKVFNIFDYISFIPPDRSFDICITTYFSILEILNGLISEKIYSKFLSELIVIFSTRNTAITIDSTPIIRFNSEDLAEAIITVQISGRKQHFTNSILFIPNVNFATMQASVHSREEYVDIGGNYIIDLEKIFGESNARTCTACSFKVAFIKEPLDGERTIEIMPELRNTRQRRLHPMVIYKHNKAQLKVER